VCVNRGNVKQLPELLATFTAMGVREFDLLHVIPFGRAYTEGKETLFYDLEEMRPYPARGVRVRAAAGDPHLAQSLPAAAPRGL
jgi:MoaA/NifB/PqqE/SkfB family radical SAM enzyme